MRPGREPLLEDWWDGEPIEPPAKNPWFENFDAADVVVTIQATTRARFAWRDDAADAILAAFGGDA